MDHPLRRPAPGWVPVERRFLGLDRATLLPAGFVLAVAIVLTGVLPLIASLAPRNSPPPARGKILGLFANQEMFQQRPEGQGDVFSPRVSLATMTSAAIDALDDSRRGFFLVVEEEGIDEFAHQNNAIRTLQTMRSLDAAVAVARRYVATHPDTLLVVTGDHETGGLTVEDIGTTDESGDGVSAEDGPFPVRNSDKQFVIDWTTGSHSGVDVPVTAAGPGSAAFTGKHPNTHAYDVLLPILTRR